MIIYDVTGRMPLESGAVVYDHRTMSKRAIVVSLGPSPYVTVELTTDRQLYEVAPDTLRRVL